MDDERSAAWDSVDGSRCRPSSDHLRFEKSISGRERGHAERSSADPHHGSNDRTIHHWYGWIQKGLNERDARRFRSFRQTNLLDSTECDGARVVSGVHVYRSVRAVSRYTYTLAEAMALCVLRRMFTLLLDSVVLIRCFDCQCDLLGCADLFTHISEISGDGPNLRSSPFLGTLHHIDEERRSFSADHRPSPGWLSQSLHAICRKTLWRVALLTDQCDGC